MPDRPVLSKKRKMVLLLTFSVAQFLDITARSGVVLFVEDISRDLNIKYQVSTWVLTAFSVPFAAFLLFWGRVADLFTAKTTFVYGFYVLGVLNLIISFLPNKYAYFILRALSGLAASATIPSAYRLIVAIFEPKEVGGAIAIFTLTGAFANASGLVLAGFFGFIKSTNQLAGWRWFFRAMTVIAIPFAGLAQALIPKIPGVRATQAEKWRQFDLIGCSIMLFSNLLLILGLTLGATYGWKTAKFLVPFLLSWPLFIAFFFWERKQPALSALVPSSTWRVPNLALYLWLALCVFGWWGAIQLPLVEIYETVYHESSIISAVRMIPMGIAALVPMLFLPKLLPILRPYSRWFISFTQIVAASSLLILIYSRGGNIHNNGYWRYQFPAFIVGSFINAMAFLTGSVLVVTSVPPSMSGVASALIQVAYQIGIVVTISIQAGLLTIHPGSIANFSNVQASWWFQFGWCLLNAILALLFLQRPPPPPTPAAAIPVKTDAEA
ncbi:hypothetical protein TREMEDRAFT_31144 [Tremella mesenterica DSM 1558]|uniref:uncharacterized protein n=1 Tax=Tremella mesenterica (strain ATCC 24925 / CBS 8224 / DSM 1558 / NBRC 9311 / NRRL Y-6157 / RJB 2259-6 / UBC 559-6) TaxID=578456 RepID=UPI0003F49B64|nr:uncharacterized protein TREMEDRAFT_31144 [Tremella mesenterica DSM 1558]EIW68921.1 hypothetical protein TREMEDRAFT_31144 [Tremella mesenterica DSM 1558]